MTQAYLHYKTITKAVVCYTWGEESQRISSETRWNIPIVRNDDPMD